VRAAPRPAQKTPDVLLDAQHGPNAAATALNTPATPDRLLNGCFVLEGKATAMAAYATFKRI
jgi:hypothetical protein